MRKKQCYEAPEAELFVVKVEENFLTSPDYNRNGTEKSNFRDGADEDLFFE